MLDFNTIVSFFEAHQLAAYALLFLIMIYEGETFLIAAGALSHVGAFNFFYVVLISFIGVVIGDILWYFVGKFLRNENLPWFMKKIVFIAENIVKRLYPNFKERPAAALMIAKFVYGTNHATLILSGLINMPFKKYLLVEIVASAIWAIAFASIGYFFGYAAIAMTHKVSIFLLIILILIIGFISSQRLISYYYENRLKDKGNNSN